jgi:tripartite-type tricarboxylate transporter receptor subunit TctC
MFRRTRRQIGRLGIGMAFAAAAALPWSAALAQDWPARPLKLIVPHAPGGVTDVVARLVAQPLGEALKQQVIVENRPGATGLLGTEIAAKAAPDGYTLLMYVDVNTMFPALVKKLQHDPVASFAPVTLLGRGSHALVAHPSLPAQTLAELVSYAKRNPKELSAALPGLGGPQWLAMEMLKDAAKIDVTAVPYKGGGQAVVDVVGGQVKLGLLGMAPVLPHIKAGKLRAIAVTGRTRSPALPDVPTMVESGFPGVEAAQWQSIVVPAGTPRPIVNRLHEELLKIMRQPAVIERLAGFGLDNATSASPEDLGRMMREEVARWPAIYKSLGVEPE